LPPLAGAGAGAAGGEVTATQSSRTLSGLDGTVGGTEGTVRWHLRHVYDKLHVRSRTEAALKFKQGQGKG